MSISQLYETVRHRRRLGCCSCQARQHGRQIEPSVEAVGELRQVTRQMLGMIRMIGAVDRILDVAEHGVDPVERASPAGGPPVHSSAAANGDSPLA